MKKLKLDEQSLQLLQAQANLSGEFHHTLRARQGADMPFRLTVDRSPPSVAFTVHMGTQRHSIELPINAAMHRKLANFIEEIANGSADDPALIDAPVSMIPVQAGKGLTAALHDQVFQLVRRGGFISLQVGLELPIHIAVHRNRSRQGVTTIMCIGHRRPRTKCFTVYGADEATYEKLAESLNDLILLATPAAEAA